MRWLLVFLNRVGWAFAILVLTPSGAMALFEVVIVNAGPAIPVTRTMYFSGLDFSVHYVGNTSPGPAEDPTQNYQSAFLPGPINGTIHPVISYQIDTPVGPVWLYNPGLTCDLGNGVSGWQAWGALISYTTNPFDVVVDECCDGFLVFHDDCFDCGYPAERSVLSRPWQNDFFESNPYDGATIVATQSGSCNPSECDGWLPQFSYASKKLSGSPPYPGGWNVSQCLPLAPAQIGCLIVGILPDQSVVVTQDPTSLTCAKMGGLAALDVISELLTVFGAIGGPAAALGEFADLVGEGVEVAADIVNAVGDALQLINLALQSE
jgi:hypothetical protein